MRDVQKFIRFAHLDFVPAFLKNLAMAFCQLMTRHSECNICEFQGNDIPLFREASEAVSVCLADHVWTCEIMSFCVSPVNYSDSDWAASFSASCIEVFFFFYVLLKKVGSAGCLIFRLAAPMAKRLRALFLNHLIMSPLSGVGSSPTLATYETSQVLLAGMPGGFSRGSPVSANLLIGQCHMS